MTTHRPPAGACRARPDHGPGQQQASRSGLLWCALGRPLWNPLWCPAPSRMKKAQITGQIRARAALSQPSSLLLNFSVMSVEEEIIESGGQLLLAAGRGRRQAGGRARQMAGRGRS